jgi:hypothetical protein
LHRKERFRSVLFGQDGSVEGEDVATQVLRDVLYVDDFGPTEAI